MHISSMIRFENHSQELPIFHDQKKGLSGLVKVEQAIHAAGYDNNPVEDAINFIVMLILAPILIPIYLVASAVTILASVIVMTIIAQSIILIAAMVFLVLIARI